MGHPSAGENFSGKDASQNSPASAGPAGGSVPGNSGAQADPYLASDDFLTLLVARNTSLSPPGNTLKPRLLSRFEPESAQSAPFTPEILEVSSADLPENLSSLANYQPYPGRSGSYSSFQRTQPVSSDLPTSISNFSQLLEHFPPPNTQGRDQDRTPPPIQVRVAEPVRASDNLESQSLFSMLDDLSSSGDRGHPHQPSDAQQTTVSGNSPLHSEVGDHSAPFVSQSRCLQNPAVSGSLVSGIAQSTASLTAGISSPSAPPPIQVTIGRVEIRLISSAVVGRMKAGSESRSLTLEDYLRSGDPR